MPAEEPIDMIRAAGALLWQGPPERRLIAVVHRNRYDDWTLPKGKLKKGESWHEAALREIKEETGYEVQKVEKLFEAYSSPGAYKELIHYFVAAITDAQKRSEGGGLAEEGEDVEMVELPFSKAIQMVTNGEIQDAKTIALLLYAKVTNLL